MGRASNSLVSNSLAPNLWAGTFIKNLRAHMAARVTIPQALAWRLFTKGIDRASARADIQIEGNPQLAEKVLQLTTIVG